MEFRVLGPLEVVSDDRILQLGGGRQLALVAVLLLHANEAVPVDRLVDDLWGESPPPTAAKIVRNAVSVLRRELGDRLVTQPPGYLLRVEENELDSERLERAVASGDPAKLSEALALWRGPPLSQVAYEPFVRDEIARLEELHLTATEAWIEKQLELGRHAEVIPELEALVRGHPLRERLSAQLMLALYRSGRQADALDVYRRARQGLDEELGIEPGPALRELERAILNQDPSLAPPPPHAPPPDPARSRARGLKLVAAGGGVLLAAAIAAAVLATRDSAETIVIPPNYVGVIDPKTNAVVAEVPVGIRPGPVAARSGSVWVANLLDRTLTKIDPRKRVVISTIPLDRRTPTGLAVGKAAVWVAHGLLGELSRVDPEFGNVTKTVPVTSRPLAAPYGSVTLGEGAVWAAFGDSTLVRISPTTARRTGYALTGSAPAAVTVGGGFVWVANSGDASVQRFNPVTFREGPVETTNVGRQPVAIDYGEGALWVASRGDDAVTRVDPGTNSTITIEVGDTPVSVAVGGGAVWVANSRSRTISRIDPATNRVVRTIEVGNPPAGVVFADGALWLTVRAG